jgi:hypothetical protein
MALAPGQWASSRAPSWLVAAVLASRWSSRSGLGPGGAPPWPGGVDRVGMHRHHRVTGGQQPVHDHAVGGLGRNRQRFGAAVAGQPAEARSKPSSLGFSDQWSTTWPAVSITVTSWVSLAQSQPTCMQHPPSSSACVWLAGVETLRRMLTVRPLIGGFPEGGHGPRPAEGGATPTGRRAPRVLGRPRQGPGSTTHGVQVAIRMANQ